MERGEKQYQEVLNFWKSRLNNRLWRLEHLYWIKNVDGIVIPFRPNEVQRKFLERQHGRNAILKARQLGLSTLVGVLMADFVFWNENKTAAIIDWRLPEGQKKLLGVRFQWEHLDYVPEGAERERRIIAWLMREKKRRLGTVKKDGSIVPVTATANKLAFRNGSVIYTDNTFRGGTTQFMHVSELAKMAKRFPDRAREVVNGGFESVPTNGTIIVESTHEGGRSGVNYNLMKTAMSKRGKPLLPVDWRFFFFPWYEESRYQLDVPEGYVFRDETIEYFTRMKEVYGVDVPESARLWWEWKNGQSDFNMGEEYPTVPDEAFDAIGDDAIYCAQFRKLRRDNRIGCRFVVHSYAPVYCSWDIGVADHMATVFFQKVGGETRIIGGIQAKKSCVLDMLARVRDFEQTHGFKVFRHLLPHDGGHHSTNDRKTNQQTLEENGCRDVRLVPKTGSVWLSIGEVRSFLPSTVWHERCGERIEDGSEEGLPGLLDCMESYHMNQNGKIDHDDCSHFADAFRMFIEAACHGLIEGFESSIVGMECLGTASCYDAGVADMP